MTKKRNVILGLSLSPHDTAACLVQDGKILCAAEQERFDRQRHSHNFPLDAIRWCLQDAGIKDIRNIAKVCVGYDLMERAKARFELRFTKDDPALSIQAAEQIIVDMKKVVNVKEVLQKEFGYTGVIEFVDHYDTHAASCYHPSPFKNAAVLIIDGAGERATTRIYDVKNNKFKTLLQIDYPNSIGRFYGWITDFLGFQIDSDEGKTMGLAPYGTLCLLPKMRKLVFMKKDGTYQLNMDYFNYQKDSKNGLSEKFYKEFGKKRAKDDPITQHHKDIARAAQRITEEVVLGLAKLVKKLTGEQNICLSGGVILNSVANGKLAVSGIFKDIYIYPASGDAGTAVGAALYGSCHAAKGKVFHAENQSPYTGYKASDKEILKAITESKLQYTKPKNISQEAAKLLAQNKVVAWYQDRAEIGPRALGNRSILADPRPTNNKDLVNKVKRREDWRPFAPSVLKDFANDYFEMNGIDSSYMIIAQDVKKAKRKAIPAVVHVDGSARVQTVTQQGNHKYWELLTEFYRLTGVPVILNTSFNLAGEPIVNTPKDALRSFMNSALDALVLGDYLIIKS